MPTSLPPELLEGTQAAAPAAPFLWLWQMFLDVQPAPGTSLVLRVVANTAPVVIGTTTFYPFPLTQSAVEQRGDGELPQMQLTLDNRTRWLSPYLDAGDGFLGREVQCWVVNGAALPSSLAGQFGFTFHVAAAEADADAVTFRLEMPNTFSIRVPHRVILADLCQWAYGSAECGYIVNDVAGFTDCPKTVDACIERGEDERARRLPVRHPDRYGAFLGVSRSR